MAAKEEEERESREQFERIRYQKTLDAQGSHVNAIWIAKKLPILIVHSFSVIVTLFGSGKIVTIPDDFTVYLSMYIYG